MAKLTAFGPIRWAKNVPPMLRPDGRPDITAHYVLLVLSTYARKDGSEARPGLETLAEDCCLTAKAAAQALDRIQAAGLISKTASLIGGTVVWQLHLEIVRNGPSVSDLRREQKRRTDADRQRRYRQRLARQQPDRHVEQRSVTPPHAVTTPSDVTACHSVSHGAAGHESRRGTPFVTAPPPSLPQVTPATTASELPKELPEQQSLFPTASDPGAAFEEFWRVYPRRVGKSAARRAWDKAIKARVIAGTIIAGARRYAAERSGQDPAYTAHPGTWLNAGRWDDEPEPHGRRTRGGHQSWRNPRDQDAYDQEVY
jgi:hypothetical protein